MAAKPQSLPKESSLLVPVLSINLTTEGNEASRVPLQPPSCFSLASGVKVLNTQHLTGFEFTVKLPHSKSKPVKQISQKTKIIFKQSSLPGHICLSKSCFQDTSH